MTRTYLLNNVIGLVLLICTTVNRESVLIQLEGDPKRFTAQETSLRATGAELFREIIEDLNIMLNVNGIVLWCDRHTPKWLAIKNSLSVVISKLGCGSTWMLLISGQCRNRYDPLDDGTTKPLLDYFRLLRDSEDDREREPVLPWKETAQLLAESRW